MKRTIASVILFSFIFSLNGFGQEGVDYDLKKPAKYENRPLGYEKTETTKFKLPRHFIQNSITHYNYYFNTNNKLNEILVRAKSQFRDDFTLLLPFYNYAFETLARDRKNLDSVIDKVNTAILVRDLRNDWVDNMLMLMGQAYYYKNKLDSAHVLFQFVNYAFAPKEKDGYPIPIGSNANADDGGNAFTISTNEKRNIVKKTFSLPPSRNESFIWQIRTYIAQEEMIRATVLIDILKHDPQFPNRLQPALHEMQALWFYKQRMYDSAAFHLTQALEVAASENERARWDYLAAQLYERSNQSNQAKAYYERSAQHAIDPIMEVYARLNAIRQNKGNENDDDYIRKNLDALQRMAHKEIYASYQDIIYFAAGEIELERNNRPGSMAFFKKSLAHGTPGTLHNRTFLKLGWLAIDAKNYKQAKTAYDSVNVTDISIADSVQVVQDRRKALNRIIPQMLTIERQDSLQRIAAMTEEERTAYIKKMLREFRKLQGLKEEELSASGAYAFNGNAANADLFGSSGSGEWYFYNSSAKAKGFNDFRSKWGNRQNTDNWMVQSMAVKQKVEIANGALGQAAGNEPGGQAAAAPTMTAAALLANVPLTPEKLKKSRDSVENAFFALGRFLQDYLPDYLTAISTYDTLLNQFPSTRFYQETLFNLFYCYTKLNDEQNAARIFELMKQKFPNGKYLGMIEHPVTEAPDKETRIKATREYEKVYEDLIEGNFDLALAEKKIADSLYGDKYWTPQLLYVEAVYFMHNRRDSLAKVELNTIIHKFSGTDMAGKAKNVLNVLNRRKEIEYYLENLQITRAKDDSTVVFDDRPAYIPNPAGNFIPKKVDKTADSIALAKKKTDSLHAAALKRAPGFVSAFTAAPDKPHSVMILMNKVDPVYVTESKNAFTRYNRENYYGKNFDINNIALNDTLKLVVISGFENADAAYAYMDKTSKIAGREIIPWLPVNKYSFLIITDNNLEVLKANKDIQGYRKFLSVYFPDKFH